MKLTKIFRNFLIVLASATAISCSQLVQPTPDEVMEKLNRGEELEAADYETILDYLDEFCDAMEEGEAQGGTYEDGKRIGEEYKYWIRFGFTLDGAPEEVKNSERYSEVGDRFLEFIRSNQ